MADKLTRPAGAAYLEALVRGLLSDGYTPSDLHQAMFDACSEDARSTEDERERAREEYCHGSDDNIEVDDNAMASRADNGVWVGAWLWLRDEDAVR